MRQHRKQGEVKDMFNQPSHQVLRQESQNPHPPKFILARRGSVAAYYAKRLPGCSAAKTETLKKTQAAGLPPLYLTPTEVGAIRSRHKKTKRLPGCSAAKTGTQSTVGTRLLLSTFASRLSRGQQPAPPNFTVRAQSRRAGDLSGNQKNTKPLDTKDYG